MKSEKPIRVLITVDTFYPCKDGVQNITESHALGLVNKGYKVQVITRLVNQIKKYEQYKGMEIYRVSIGTKYGIHYGNKNEYISLVKKLAKNNDVLINTGTETATTDYLLDHLDEIKIPKILYLHGRYDFLFHGEFSRGKSLIKKLYFNSRWALFYAKNGNKYKKYNRIINLLQEDEATVYFEKYVDKVDIIHNFVEKDKFNDDKLIKKNQIVCVANYSNLKNQIEVLDVFYAANINNYKLVFIGSEENDYCKMLEKRVCELFGENQNRVEIKFNISREDLAEYVKSSKLFMFCSKLEKLPVSILEAMACKTAFLAMDVGSIRYLPGGIVVQDKNEMINWLKELCNDEQLLKEYGEIGWHQVSKNYDFDIENEKLKNIIDELIIH